MSIYGTSGQATFSTSYPDLPSMINDFPDNTSNLIKPRQLRNAILSLYYNTTLATFSGLTLSNGIGVNVYDNSLIVDANGLYLNPNIVGNGLTYSGGSFSTITPVNGKTNYIPYFNTTTGITDSNIQQTNNNILIGTTSNVGAKLYIAGSFSSTGNAIISGINIGSIINNTNTILGNNNLNINHGTYNTFLGYNSGNDLYTGSYNLIINTSTSSIGLTNGSYNTIIGSSLTFSNLSNYVVIGDGAGNKRIVVDNTGNTTLQSITVNNSPSQSYINIISVTDSSYYVPGGTTSFYYSGANYGKISFINKLYGSNELASISVVSYNDSSDGYNPSTYSFNTGNIIFSIGASASAATEKVRMSSNNMYLTQQYTLQLGYTNGLFENNRGPKSTLSIKYNSTNGGLYVFDNGTSPKIPGYISIQSTTSVINGLTIAGGGPTIFTAPSVFRSNSYPGRDSTTSAASIYTSGNQYGVFARPGFINSATNSATYRSYGFTNDMNAILLPDTGNTYSMCSFISYGAMTVIAGALNSNNNLTLTDFNASDFTLYSAAGTCSGLMTRYGLLIDYNTATQSYTGGSNGTFSYSNPWGVYQSNDANNFFNGYVYIGASSSIISSAKLQVKSNIYLSGALITGTYSGQLSAINSTWKLGGTSSGTGLIMDTINYVEVNINGAIVKLATIV